MTAALRSEDRRGFEFPPALTILFEVVIVTAALTWVIPAGEAFFVSAIGA